MKILIVLLRIPGGVGRANTEIAEALRKKGHEVDMLSRENHLQKYSLKSGFFPIRKKIKRLMEEKNYDIIYTQDYSCALPLIFPYPIFYNKHFYCSIGVKYSGASKVLQDIAGKIMGRRVIVLFHHNKKRFPKSHVVYRAVNIDQFKPLGKKREHFGWINKFSEMGNQKIYEKAAKDLGLKPMSAGGSGKKSKSKDKNKGKIVIHSFDKINDMNKDFYNECRVFINLATPDAGFNLSWMEAMAAGVPIVIGNNNGAGPIMPFDKINEWKDQKDFEEQINKIIKNPKKINYRKWLIDNGFTWDRVAEELLEVFESCGRKYGKNDRKQ